jgi:hypothetical protein
MKIESAHDKDIIFENWNTPVIYNEQLWLLSQIYNGSDIHFFFQKNHGSDDIHVLTIPWTSPFRITEEGLGWTYIGNYFINETPAQHKEKKCSTYKIWNTSFAKNTYRSRPLSEEERNPEDIFQYLIITQDVWIEFVTLDTIEWEFYENADPDKLVLKYIEQKNINT